jgi:hypothetical protein
MSYPKDPPFHVVPQAPLWLGIAGVVPFLIGGLIAAIGAIGDTASVAGISAAWALKAQIGYGAVILSFLGGVRWGLALPHRSPDRQAQLLAFSVVPSLIGWVALFPAPGYGLTLLIVAFAAQGAWDALDSGRAGMPKWYGTLRVWLTLAVTGILLLTLIAIGL